MILTVHVITTITCHNSSLTQVNRNFTVTHFGFRIRKLRLHHFRLGFWYAIYATILFRGLADRREQVLQYT